jgi:hypothetical protein
MKTLLLLVCILAATAAFGQAASAISSEVSPMYIPDHPQHASQHEMTPEQSILGTNSNPSAHGERPLWEFATTRVERPLGDIARELRKQRDIVPTNKVRSVIEN